MVAVAVVATGVPGPGGRQLARPATTLTAATSAVNRTAHRPVRGAGGDAGHGGGSSGVIGSILRKRQRGVTLRPSNVAKPNGRTGLEGSYREVLRLSLSAVRRTDLAPMAPPATREPAVWPARGVTPAYSPRAGKPRPYTRLPKPARGPPASAGTVGAGFPRPGLAWPIMLPTPRDRLSGLRHRP